LTGLFLAINDHYYNHNPCPSKILHAHVRNNCRYLDLGIVEHDELVVHRERKAVRLQIVLINGGKERACEGYLCVRKR